MELEAPGQAHRALERLVGEWEGQETIHPSPWDPGGGQATSRTSNRSALVGFAVVHDYVQVRDGRRYEGHGVFHWDADRGQHVLAWSDSSGMPPSEFRGGFDGSTLTLTSRGPQGQSRAVFDWIDETSYNFRMDVSPDGKGWQPFLEGVYRRVETGDCDET